jgi:hypothetical protein
MNNIEDTLNIPFHKVTLDDKEWINTRLTQSNYYGCEYSFSNIFLWSTMHEFRIADYKGFLIIKAREEGECFYYFPAGEGDLSTVIMDLVSLSEKRGEPLVFGNVTSEHIELLEKIMPGSFEYEENRESTDYIYLREKMVSLAGKKLHGKRNHINRFKDNPNWNFEFITEDNISECYAMSVAWSLEHFADNPNSGDFCSVQKAFDYFKELDLMGGLIRQDGRVIAFTIGAMLNLDTVVIHIEKAHHEIQGAYPIINQQFAEHLPEQIKYINREEDLGSEGLRRAKLSYQPEILLHKSIAILDLTKSAIEK